MTTGADGGTGATGGAAGGTGGTGGTGSTGGNSGGGNASAGAGNTGGTGVAPEWHGIAAADASGLEYVKNKGWTGVGDVIKSYQGAEKLIGRDPSTLLSIPRADDAAGYRAAFARLGMPETSDKYDLALPEGHDPAYATWAKGAFHAAGLTASQAKALSAANTEYVKTQQANATKDYERTVATQKTELLSEWRGGYERQMSAAQTAVKALGFTGEMVDAIESAIGYKESMKFWAGIGAKLGEDSFEGVGAGAARFGATMTPAEAKGEWDKMKLDPTQTAALKDLSHPGHEAASKKQKELFAIMYPEG